MNGQGQQFFRQRMTKFLCLRFGGLRGNQDFTFLFFQSETEYVGRPVVAEKLLVIIGNFSVVDQDNAEVFKGDTGNFKRLVYLLAEIFYVYFYVALQVAQA